MHFLKAIILTLLVTGAAWALKQPAEDGVLGSYVTSLEGRTYGQRKNARLSAQRLDGVTVGAGQVFSFNRFVGPWTPDRGYVIALVSYDGELVSDWGGGVCQTSTTLYNAALLAGLEVVERHKHTWAPKYIPPGRDAAVAQVEADLKLRNPYSWPVKIRTLYRNGSIGFEVRGKATGPMAAVQARTQATVSPVEILRTDGRLQPGQRRLLNRGRSGTRAAVYRTYLQGPHRGVRELVSQDSYPAMNRVVTVGNRE